MNLRTLSLIALLAILLFITAKVLADVKAERIKIKIEDTYIEEVVDVAADIEGVIETSWDEETGELEIIFEQDKTSLQEIEKTISEAGFDTPNHEAPQEAAKETNDSDEEEISAGK